MFIFPLHTFLKNLLLARLQWRVISVNEGKERVGQKDKVTGNAGTHIMLVNVQPNLLALCNCLDTATQKWQ